MSTCSPISLHIAPSPTIPLPLNSSMCCISLLTMSSGLIAAAVPILHGSTYDFMSIASSPELNWIPCYGNPKLTCSLLQVHLDYTNINAGTVNIAYVKYTSTNQSTQDIIYNPGGPGGSGVNSVVEAGETILRKLSSQFNLIGFDPRGVGHSGPNLTCSPNKSKVRRGHKLSERTIPLEDFLGIKAGLESCSRFNLHTNAKYAGTVANSQDIAHLLDLNQAQKGVHGKPQLWYYGQSYGTVLGQTFAALYPDRVGRMILDGNIDGTTYYTGFDPDKVHDTVAAFQNFFESCYEAGPEKCEFFGNATRPEDISNRYLALVESLKTSPLNYTTPAKRFEPEFITDDMVTTILFDAMYDPLSKFSVAARKLSILEQGNVDLLLSEPDRLIGADIPSYVVVLIIAVDVKANFSIKSYD